LFFVSYAPSPDGLRDLSLLGSLFDQWLEHSPISHLLVRYLQGEDLLPLHIYGYVNLKIAALYLPFVAYPVTSICHLDTSRESRLDLA
jgi:hypothetical protein